jgi:predicted metal-dependent enzyme (double-stranded beta helix superfamily)
MMLASRTTAKLSPARLGQIAGSVAARPEGWGDVLRFDARRRWYRRLELADDHEVWLLTWLPGQSTGFHDHGNAAGAFAVARGRVSERTAAAFAVGEKRVSERTSTGFAIAPGRVSEPTVGTAGHRVRHRTISAGGVRSFGPQHVHDVINISGEPAVSVHAYSPPLTAMQRYNLTASGLIPAVTESAEQDW